MNRRKKGVLDVLCYVKDIVESIAFVGSCFNAVMIPVIEKSSFLSILPEFALMYIDFFNSESGKYIINCLVLTFLIIKLFVVCYKNNRQHNETVINLMGDLHDKCIHDMRDHLHSLTSIKDAICSKNYNKVFAEEFKKLQNISKQCVDQLSDIINGQMGLLNDVKPVCACIKMIGNTESTPIAKKPVITLARSYNTQDDRIKKSDVAIIEENTDFLDLSYGYRNYFSGTNLKEKFAKSQYKNSSINFKYESTIVVPIRYNGLNVNIKTKEDNQKKNKGQKRKRKQKKQIVEINTQSNLDLIGYLCIDTERILKDWEEYKKVKKILKILSVYADLMYIYIRAFMDSFGVGESI